MVFIKDSVISGRTILVEVDEKTTAARDALKDLALTKFGLPAQLQIRLVQENREADLDRKQEVDDRAPASFRLVCAAGLAGGSRNFWRGGDDPDNEYQRVGEADTQILASDS